MKKSFFVLFAVLGISLHVHAQIWAEVYGLYSWPVRDVLSLGERSITSTDGTNYRYKLTDIFSQIAKPTVGSGLVFHYVRNGWDVGFDIRLVEYAPKLDFVRVNLLTVGVMTDRYFAITDALGAFAGAEISMVQSRVYYRREQIDQPRLDQTRPAIALRAGVALRVTSAVAFRAGFRLTGVHIFPSAEAFLGIGYNLGDF